MSDNIIVIGAHPDDIEIGCAGTIRKMVLENKKVFFLIATLGEKCDIKNIELDAITQKRKSESMKAANFLGVTDIFYLGLPDTQIVDNGITVSSIEKYINMLNPSYIFTHTKEDNHQDHRNIAYSTISACRRKKTNILHYESPSTSQKFIPTIFSDITNTIEDKITAINFFTSQNEKIYVEQEAIKGLARYRGYISGSQYAESFEISKYYI